MLDLKFVRSNPEAVIEALAKRGGKISLDSFLAVEEERRSILGRVEEMKAHRNTVSKQIGIMKKSGEDASALMSEMRALGDEISALDERLKELEDALTDQLMRIPNIPHPSVPVGPDDSANVEQRRWGEPRQFDFTPLNQWLYRDRPALSGEQ